MSLATQTPPSWRSSPSSRAAKWATAWRRPSTPARRCSTWTWRRSSRKHWLFSAAEAEIPDAGDYVTIDIGPYSVIILRDDDEEIRAFHNVCRHRGSRLLKEPCGAVGNIVCPYHQWTYRTDGSLIFAESQPPTFDRSRFGLRPIHVQNVAGLIFICLDENPPADFDEVASFIEPYLTPYELSNAKVAHQIDLPEEGNWKLVMENNRECQHCDGAHPELVTGLLPAVRLLRGRHHPPAAAGLRPVPGRGGRPRTGLRGPPVPAGRAARARHPRRPASRSPTCRWTATASASRPDGAQVCKKLMGSLTEPKFGDLSLHLQPNSWFHFLSDHAVVFRVLPLSADKSIVRTTWLVHPDAVEGVDYDVES